MPRKVAALAKSRAGKNTNHNWDVLADGVARRFTKGVDFNCKPSSFRTMFYGVCASRRWKPASRIEGDSVILQVELE